MLPRRRYTLCVSPLLLWLIVSNVGVFTSAETSTQNSDGFWDVLPNEAWLGVGILAGLIVIVIIYLGWRLLLRKRSKRSSLNRSSECLLKTTNENAQDTEKCDVEKIESKNNNDGSQNLQTDKDKKGGKTTPKNRGGKPTGNKIQPSFNSVDENNSKRTSKKSNTASSVPNVSSNSGIVNIRPQSDSTNVETKLRKSNVNTDKRSTANQRLNDTPLTDAQKTKPKLSKQKIATPTLSTETNKLNSELSNIQEEASKSYSDNLNQQEKVGKQNLVELASQNKGQKQTVKTKKLK